MPPARRKRKIVTGPDPMGPRVVIIGDSYIFGLGYTGGPAFGRLIADRLGFSALLNLSASSRTAAETMELYADQISDFRPTIAVVCVGAAEGLVEPRQRVQELIERFAPASWHGVAGLAPRAAWSQHWTKRIGQQAVSGLKVAVKWTLIKTTGGGPRTPLVESIDSTRRLLELLTGLGTDTFMVGLPHVPGVRFPGTDESFRRTTDAQQTLTAGMPTVTYLPTADQLDYYGDFLDDRLHLGASGHERIALAVLQQVDGYFRPQHVAGRSS